MISVTSLNSYGDGALYDDDADGAVSRGDGDFVGDTNAKYRTILVDIKSNYSNIICDIGCLFGYILHLIGHSVHTF